jgi:subtilisin
MKCIIPPDLKIGASAVTLAPNVNWGMDAFKIPLIRDRVKTKIKIGIIDTGCDPSHPALTNLVKAKDFTGSASGSADRNGHGTHCSGTVGSIYPTIGVASGFDLYHGKGLGDSGSGGSGLIDAMEWCISEGCEILSCSWGGGGQDAGWEARFRAMVDAGVWLVFAGGNSGPNTPDTDWPGRSQNLINVAALNRDFTPASFSSAGDKIDTSGPGVDIWSCKPGGGYQSMSGTSMATPFVAGLLGLYRALLKQNNQPIPKVPELRKALFLDSTDIHTPGDDRRTGPGWITPILLALDSTPDPSRIG